MTLPCSVQNFNTFGQKQRMLWTNEILRDLVLYGLTLEVWQDMVIFSIYGRHVWTHREILKETCLSLYTALRLLMTW